MSKPKFLSPTLLLVILFVVCMAGAWWTLAQIFSTRAPATAHIFGFDIPPAPFLLGYGLVVLSAVWFSLIILLDESFWMVASAACAALASALFLLFQQPSMYMLGVVPALALFLFAALRMRQIMNDLLPWKPSWALQAGLPLFFLGLNIFLTAVVTISPLGKAFLDQPLPHTVFDVTLSYIAKPLQQFAGIDINGTVDRAITDTSGGKLKDPKLLAMARDEYSKSLQMPLSGKENVKDIMYAIINREFDKIKTKVGNLLLVVLAVSTFFTFQFLAWPAKILATIGARFVLFLLEALGAIVIEDKPVRKYMARWRTSVPKI